MYAKEDMDDLILLEQIHLGRIAKIREKLLESTSNRKLFNPINRG